MDLVGQLPHKTFRLLRLGHAAHYQEGLDSQCTSSLYSDTSEWWGDDLFRHPPGKGASPSQTKEYSSWKQACRRGKYLWRCTRLLPGEWDPSAVISPDPYIH